MDEYPLLKRLRTMSAIGWHPIGDEAANRIEQLEEAMRWVLGTIGADHPAKKVIRAALGEKKDGN